MKILLEGRPGSGKTTVAARFAELLRERGVPLGGFLTHELRTGSGRVGFELETFEGARATLAHVDFDGPPRVGKYGVDLEALETVGVPALERLPRSSVVVVDELGKMELASERFRDAVSRIFESPVTVVATVQAARHPFTDGIKERPDVERVTVTRANRDELPADLVDRVA